MKLKFVLLSCLLLFARGCDFYSTSLWFFQENGMQDETNPLTSILGMGWNGLIITNLLLVTGILIMYYFYCFKYQMPNKLSPKPNNFFEYTSLLYFDQKDKFHRIFFRIPKNKRAATAHMGYVLVRTLIVASFLATIHNICQFYGYAFYDTFRAIVKRPLWVIYGLIAISLIYFYQRLLKKEFQLYGIAKS